MLETSALLDTVLATGLADDCVIDGSPANTIRVLYSSPFLGVDAGTGVSANTKPEAYAKASDVAAVVPESTVLTIDGTDYVAERIEAVEGGNAWKLLMLREV